jgi:hypothetical protein
MASKRPCLARSPTRKTLLASTPWYEAEGVARQPVPAPEEGLVALVAEGLGNRVERGIERCGVAPDAVIRCLQSREEGCVRDSGLPGLGCVALEDRCVPAERCERRCEVHRGVVG